RAMETAAVLYRAPALATEWNQIHLCELDPEGFEGFGPEFAAALREEKPDTPRVFAGLDRLRTVPRWTFCDPVLETDTALARGGRAETQPTPRARA
ncbi:MAG: hypothetical protein AAFY88_28065, partial [Acidobacteriota bacterium]